MALDSFIDNPVISALGGALGLGHIFAAAGSATPAPDVDADAPPKPAASKPNVPVDSNKNRPYIPRNEGAGLGTAGGVRPGVLPLTPGTMDPQTLQNPDVQRLLGQYGVTPSDQAPDPNLFIHNPQAYANHPVIANAIERTLGSLANAHPGYNFLSSLSGSLKGNEEYDEQRAAQVNAQTMAPIQQALQIQNLQHGSDVHDEAVDNMDYHKGLLAHYAATDLTKQQRIAAMPPKFGKNGQPYLYTEDDDGKPSYKADSDWTPDPRTEVVNAYYQNKKAELVKQYGSLENVPSDKLADVEQDFQTHMSYGKGAAAMRDTDVRAAVSARKGAGGPNASLSPREKAQLADLSKQETEVNKRIDKIANLPAGSMAVDDSGNRIGMAGGTKHKDYLKKLNDQANDIHQQKLKIIGGGAPSAPAGYSAGNPFAPK